MYNRTPATPSHPHRKPLLFLLPLLFACLPAAAQAKPAAAPEKIIIDTDIGDDLDDAFAVGLALHSPELQLLGITTTFGDTELRARLLDRFLGALGRTDIPVAAGTPTHVTNVFTQRAYALGAYPSAGRTARPAHPAAVDFLAQQINLYPGQITLIAIGPLVNVGALIDQHPDTFRKLKRVVLMGGSIYRGYGDYQYLRRATPNPSGTSSTTSPPPASSSPPASRSSSCRSTPPWCSSTKSNATTSSAPAPPSPISSPCSTTSGATKPPPSSTS